MPNCSHDNQNSLLSSPDFTDDTLLIPKQVKLVYLLQNIIKKCQYEPQFLSKQPKETDLLVSTAQLILTSSSPSSIPLDDKQDILNNIVSLGQDLLRSDEHLVDDNNNSEEVDSSIDSTLQLNKNIDVTTNDVLRSNTTNNDSDGDYSLDDLANEFLLNETLPSPNSATSAELKKSDTAPDDAGTVILSSSRSTSPPNSLSKSPSSNKFILNESPLESILFSNRLSSQDAAADADCIWKEKSSPLGQIFCTKTNEFQTKATKRISTCLFDRSLHERLTRLIALLPKQCIRNTIHALPVSHGEQLNQLLSSSRPQMRLINRNTSQQNSSQTRPAQRFSAPRNSRQYVKLYGSNQQGSPSGSLTDQRPRPLLQQQQQSRYSLRSYYGQHTSDRQQQSINGPANSQQTSNQNYQHHHHYHQRSTRNRFSGGKAGDRR